MSDWWQKKLAAQQPAPPSQAQMPALAQMPTPAVSPYWGAVPPQGPVSQPVAPSAQEAQPQGFVSYDAGTGRPQADDGTVALLHNAAAGTGGSRAMQAANGVCPECGGGNYFARDRTENGMMMRTPASPQCFDCGFPIIQAGSQHGGATLAGGSRGGAPPGRTRQLPANHQVTVVLDGGVQMTYGASRR